MPENTEKEVQGRQEVGDDPEVADVCDRILANLDLLLDYLKAEQAQRNTDHVA